MSSDENSNEDLKVFWTSLSKFEDELALNISLTVHTIGCATSSWNKVVAKITLKENSMELSTSLIAVVADVSMLKISLNKSHCCGKITNLWG